MFPSHRALIEGYFALRKTARIKEGHRFEGQQWIANDYVVERRSDGWRLRIYEIDGEIEACVIAPTGESWTHA